MILILILSLVFPLFIGTMSFLRLEKAIKYVWVLPLLGFLYLFSFLPETLNGGISHIEKIPWIAHLKMDLQFAMRPFSLLFSLLITGIGTLVFYYAGAYMENDARKISFFRYLAFFMAAMLGVVFSDNLIILFLFWELTSIASFFLIGFNHEEREVRQSAMLSLGITGGGGFFLLLAFTLIGYAAGTFNLSEIELHNLVDSLQMQGTLNWVLFSLFLGTFTKSAQFPFHFWLPNAMKAPTPVSAYLHSATMVKAGVFLLATFAPYFQGVALWHYGLFFVGLFTLAYAAFVSLFQKDLKGILAYTTVASLAMMVMLIGIGTEMAYLALLLFIVAHAIYKAGLFITAGSLDVLTGTRNVNHLRGAFKIAPFLGIAAFIVACSNGGMPLTLGFMAKDFIYISFLDNASVEWIFLSLVILANICLLVAGLLVGWRPFMGEKSNKVEKAKEFSAYKFLPFWLPVMILAILSLILGLLPNYVFENLLKGSFLQFTNAVTLPKLQLFPGFEMELLLSGITLVAGLLLYFIKRGKPFIAKIFSFNSIANPFKLMLQFYKWSTKVAFRYTRLMHSGYLRNYILYIVLFFIGLVGYELFTSVDFNIPFDKLNSFGTYELVIFIIIIFAIFLAVFTSSRLTAIASMGIVGYCMCLMFVFYGAPDLAMTQFSIDTLTVVLFVLVLYRLPQFRKYDNAKVQLRNGLVSLTFGILISLIALHAYNQPVIREVSEYYAHNAYLKAKGKNVVNVVLVDFRGFDTMVEIIVLAIAAIGVFSMLKLNPDQLEKN